VKDRALVTLSGGQDSVTVLFLAKQKYKSIFALTFDYEQRHQREIEAASMVARLADVEHHEVLHLGPILHGKSPLTNYDQDLETYDSYEQMEEVIGDRVEKTFVPLRNALFLTIAANRAATDDIYDIYTGVSSADLQNYPDCRRAFVDSQQYTIRLALGQEKEEKRMKIRTPLVQKTKAQSIDLALSLPGCYTALGFSHTAYSGEFPPITPDHSSVLRAQGFLDAMCPDPLIVRAYWTELCMLPQTPNYTAYAAMIDDVKSNDSIIEKLQSLENYVKEQKQIPPYNG
jgi:7-cyano-7-deazaguanine synthase